MYFIKKSKKGTLLDGVMVYRYYAECNGLKVGSGTMAGAVLKVKLVLTVTDEDEMKASKKVINLLEKGFVGDAYTAIAQLKIPRKDRLMFLMVFKRLKPLFEKEHKNVIDI